MLVLLLQLSEPLRGADAISIGRGSWGLGGVEVFDLEVGTCVGVNRVSQKTLTFENSMISGEFISPRGP